MHEGSGNRATSDHNQWDVLKRGDLCWSSLKSVQYLINRAPGGFLLLAIMLSRKRGTENGGVSAEKRKRVSDALFSFRQWLKWSYMSLGRQ